jgi:Na+/H+ antiporter NhaA
MSLFIATLAFQRSSAIDAVKVGILVDRFLAGAVGAILVRRGTRSPRRGLAVPS